MENNESDFISDILGAKVPNTWMAIVLKDVYEFTEELKNSRTDNIKERAKRSFYNVQAFLFAKMKQNYTEEYELKVKEIVERRDIDLKKPKSKEKARMEEIYYQYWLERYELLMKFMEKSGMLGVTFEVAR